MPEIAIFLIFAFAMFVQTSAGFGSALIAMPLLASILGAKTATPLFALSYFCVAIIVTYRYRHYLKIKNMWRLSLASLMTVPVGVHIISHWDEHITLFLYGVFIIAYAIYALLGFQPPRLKNPNLQWGFGFLAGMISGAYNTSGPIYVIYGDSQQWNPFEFKGNLQLLFFLNSILSTTNHYLVGNMTDTVFGLLIYAIPGLFVGTLLGFVMDRYIQPAPFRKVVQLMLLVIGIMLVI